MPVLSGSALLKTSDSGSREECWHSPATEGHHDWTDGNFTSQTSNVWTLGSDGASDYLLGRWYVDWSFQSSWQVPGDPCLVAAAATVVITTCLWLTRWQGSRGATFERYLLAAFLVYMALVYVMRYQQGIANFSQRE